MTYPNQTPDDRRLTGHLAQHARPIPASFAPKPPEIETIQATGNAAHQRRQGKKGGKQGRGQERAVLFMACPATGNSWLDLLRFRPQHHALKMAVYTFAHSTK